MKGRAWVTWWLMTGRWEGAVCGLGISGCINAGASRAARRQRRHSTDEGGESRRREGRQENGVSRLPRLKLPVASASNGCADGRSRSFGICGRDRADKPQVKCLLNEVRKKSVRKHSFFNRHESDLAGSRSCRSSSSPSGAGDRRAVCGKSASTVRREGRPERAVPTPIRGGTSALIRWRPI